VSDVLLAGAPEKKRESFLSGFDKFVQLAFRIFAKPASFVSKSQPQLRDQILKSNLRTTPEGLSAIAIFCTTFVGIGVLILTYVGVVIGGIIYFAFLPIAIPIVFIVIMSLPRFSSATRAASIDTEMPFVLGYMSVLAGGGVSPIAAMRRIADMKILPASSKEAKRILVETDIFGSDPISAMEKAAKDNPSKNFSEFLFGYTSVLKTGGDFVAYIQTKLRDLIENKAAAVKRSSDSTGTIAEAYLTVTVILGMTLYTLYMIQTILAGNSGGLVNLYLFAFLIVPLLSATFIWMIDAIQPKWPYTDYRPYKVFGYSIPVALLIFILPIPLPLYLHVALTLSAVSIAPGVYSIRLSRERRGLEKALPDFIRDVTEGRKTGLSPEQAIERLSSRHYGILSQHVTRMASQLSWGVSLSKVVSTFTAKVNSWLTRAIGVLLVEVVDVGGGTIKSFTEMASFTRTINDLENDRRAALRPFVYITYVAGIMVIITTFIMVYFLGQPAAFGFGGATIDSSTIDDLLTTAVFDSFIIGLVAGKMGESNLSDGFKHGLALVVISVIAVQIAKLFIKIPV